MARQRHLPHAPITEALIDIHVEPRHDLTFAGLQETIGAPEFGYYVKNPISQGTFAFKLTSDSEQPQTTAEASQIGLRLHSDDEKYVAQCRLSGFTLSRLRPYEEWSREAKRVWAIYTERLAPVRVTRVGTRFINNLQLPMHLGGSFQEYLHKLVDVPDEAPQAVASFLQRFQLVDVQSNALVNLTLALESTPTLRPAPVVLDVDAFIVKDLDPGDEELWVILEHLRALKNRCFFGSLTERAAELYE
ncbi:MAG: TIGR04255 family protein [Gammaproteobacteria bacterium]